jgi:hypothetical protein
MAGTLAPRFYSYYLVAYLLKEPLASVVLTTVGLIMLLRRKTDSKLTLGFLLIPMAVLFMGYTIFSDNIGIRYILPVLPFAHLAGGVALASIAQSNSMWKRAAGALLCIWLLVAAVAIYPDHLSYFNEAACLLKDPTNIGFDGGTRCGPLWLDDSNVDWGQGLKQLKVWLDKNAPGQQVRLGYFGAGIPESYGIVHVPMNDDDLLSVQTPGLYVVSSHLVASTPAIAKRIRPDGAEWLRQTRPVAIIGHALYVFDIAR